MKKDESRLGKGLGAIFGEDLSNVIEEIQQGDDSRQSEIKLSEIRSNPYQPRKIFDDGKIEELAQSIREHGVFTPILVRRSVKGYELIAGERRVRASKKAGLKTIPAIVMEFTEEQMMEISLLENIQRPYFLAGGLDADNIETALAQLAPYGVDVSSGIETAGEKDPEKMRAFVMKVRENRRKEGIR